MNEWQILYFVWAFLFTPIGVWVLHSWELEQRRRLKASEAAFHVAETERKRLAEKVFQLEIQLMRMPPTVAKGSFAPDSIFSNPGSRGR